MKYTGVYHLKLANYLYENGYKVAVVNPFSIKKFMEAKMTKVKTEVAVVHKLLRQGIWCIKSRRPFDENFCT
jgi:transposase